MDLSWLAPLIPVIIPVVGALATVLTARLGIGGRLRRLDLLSARLKLTQSLWTRFGRMMRSRNACSIRSTISPQR